MKEVFVVCGEEGYVRGIFATREAALETYGPDAEIESRVLHDSAIPPTTRFVRGAEVYPDGHVYEWSREEQCRGECEIAPCDDHLSNRDEPWDGHTQSHCGEHIYISGTSRELVEESFQRHLAKAVGRQDGVCHSRFAHRENRTTEYHQNPADGVNIYDAGFMQARVRGKKEKFRPDYGGGVKVTLRWSGKFGDIPFSG